VAKQNEFVNYLLELLQAFGNVSARAMFGGYGIYKDGLIFGLVIDDAFYLKVDDVNRGEFEARGLAPFLYESKNREKQISLGYYQCPEDALESAGLMVEWAKSGYGAALRAAAKKHAGKRTVAKLDVTPVHRKKVVRPKK
jgi:DNA transformation protein and related proteins